MIIIKIEGGLGNQLQQYSLGVKLSSLGKQVKYDISGYYGSQQGITRRELELTRFENIELDIATHEEIHSILSRNTFVRRMVNRVFGASNVYYLEHQMYDEGIYELTDAYLEGYFACEAYYRDVLDLLLKQLVLPIDRNERNYILAQKMLSEESISIHIRRGDYLNDANRDIFGNICTEEYYDKAIEVARNNASDAHMYIFSDDISYINNKFCDTDGITIVDWNKGSDSIFDMYLMSHCKVNICANSTFSFWGARLNQREDKVMIRPLKQRNNMEYIPEVLHELWPEWMLIDENGEVR